MVGKSRWKGMSQSAQVKAAGCASASVLYGTRAQLERAHSLKPGCSEKIYGEMKRATAVTGKRTEQRIGEAWHNLPCRCGSRTSLNLAAKIIRGRLPHHGSLLITDCPSRRNLYPMSSSDLMFHVLTMVGSD